MIIEGVITASQLYEFIKFWLPAGTIVTLLWKGSNWFGKKAKTVDDIKPSIDMLDATVHTKISELSDNVTSQTAQIVSELKEMRADFRTFYVPFALSAPQMTGARAKPQVQRRRKTSGGNDDLLKVDILPPV